MPERHEIEQWIRHVYAERQTGDIDRVMACFAPNPTFVPLGAPERAVGAEATTSALTTMLSAFELLEYKIYTILVDGQRAVVHWRGKFRAGNGRVGETDSLDLITIEDGKIASLHTFFDTAAAQDLLRPN